MGKSIEILIIDKKIKSIWGPKAYINKKRPCQEKRHDLYALTT